MSAVFKREFKAFFTSPVGYFVLAVLFGFAGFYFFANNMYGRSADLTGVFGGLFTIVLLLVLPVLTMRLFSDEKRQRTDQALLTAPVSLTGIALGKFFAALLMFAIGISITIVFAIIIAFQVTPDWLVIIGNYVGLLLLGGMIIAIGMFISSLTESQFIAALGTFAISFALLMVDSLASVFYSVSWIGTVVEFISVSARYNEFTSGVINYDNIVFFISMIGLFVFLTVRVLDRKRWS
mgnify:CR=1 FL=1|jgi:hypothetical protein